MRRDRRLSLRITALIFAVLLVGVPAFSQATQATIQGGVFDQTGGAIAGAGVTVVDVARGVARNLVTDGAGQYVARPLTHPSNKVNSPRPI